MEQAFAFEVGITPWIHLIGVLIESFGVLTLVLGIVWATLVYAFRTSGPRRYDEYRIRIGRTLLLGLEILVAADIVKTVAIDLTFTSIGLLAGLVVIRTFLSWSLMLEIEGRWPWQRSPRPLPDGAAASD